MIYCLFIIVYYVVDGLALQVLAVPCHAAGPAAQHLVGLRRPIGGDNLERSGAARFLLNLEKNVEHARVHRHSIVGPEVAQQVIEVVEC